MGRFYSIVKLNAVNLRLGSLNLTLDVIYHIGVKLNVVNLSLERVEFNL